MISSYLCFRTVLVSETAAITVKVCSESLPEPNSTPKLDVKLEKLNIYAHQPVIFPDHLQVPEDFKNGLIFGSLDATLEQIVDHVNNSDDTESSMPATELLKESDEPAKEASMRSVVICFLYFYIFLPLVLFYLL